MILSGSSGTPLPYVVDHESCAVSPEYDRTIQLVTGEKDHGRYVGNSVHGPRTCVKLQTQMAYKYLPWCWT